MEHWVKWVNAKVIAIEISANFLYIEDLKLMQVQYRF